MVKIYNSLWFGLALGCFAAAILLINNYRDLEGDIKAHKLTLVYYLGRAKAQTIYAFLLIFPYFILIYLWANQEISLSTVLFTSVSFLLAIKLIYQLYISPINQQLNQLLAQTALLQLLYTILLSFSFY